jgi:hypothetical protein
LTDIVVDGDAGVHSASKKKAWVQVVLAPLLMELPVRSEVWQYRRGVRTLRPRVACTSVIMEVELGEAERDGRKVLQLAEKSKAELQGADYRPREVEESEEEEECRGDLSEEARKEAEDAEAEEEDLLEVAELEAQGLYIVKAIVNKRTLRNGDVEYLVDWENYQENEWVSVGDLVHPNRPKTLAIVREFEDKLLVARRPTRAGRERRPNTTLKDFV